MTGFKIEKYEAGECFAEVAGRYSSFYSLINSGVRDANSMLRCEWFRVGDFWRGSFPVGKEILDIDVDEWNVDKTPYMKVSLSYTDGVDERHVDSIKRAFCALGLRRVT
jgi:hypothetical protein